MNSLRRKARISKPLFVLAAWCLLPVWLGSGQGAKAPTEYEVKADFLYNFAKFVEWPRETFRDQNSPIIIGIVGDDSLEDTLNRAIGNKLVQGRKLLVKQWKRNEKTLYCQILFISSSASNPPAEILRSIKGAGMLTVGETEGFAQQGGIINFILSGDKLAFEINHKSAESAGLKISSKLLRLAKTVWE